MQQQQNIKEKPKISFFLKLFWLGFSLFTKLKIKNPYDEHEIHIICLIITIMTTLILDQFCVRNNLQTGFLFPGLTLFSFPIYIYLDSTHAVKVNEIARFSELSTRWGCSNIT